LAKGRDDFVEESCLITHFPPHLAQLPRIDQIQICIIKPIRQLHTINKVTEVFSHDAHGLGDFIQFIEFVRVLPGEIEAFIDLQRILTFLQVNIRAKLK